MTEDELVAAMTLEMEVCDAPLECVLQPTTALQLAGLLQLVLRHPKVDGPAARTGRTFIEYVRAYFEERHAIAVLEVMRRGDDPREDR